MLKLSTALILLLVSHTAAAREFSVGFITGYNDYKEPGIMREYGELFGVNGRWSRVLPMGLSWNLEAELVAGRLLYDGGSEDKNGNITRFTQPTTDYIGFARADLGWNFVFAPGWAVMPYVGMGYRMLNDKIDGNGSYNRNVTYLYFPIGVQLATLVMKRWKVTATAEYDVMPYGTVMSYLSEASTLPDLTNHNKGGGGRLTATVYNDLGNFGWHAGLFYQKWKVGESDHSIVKSGSTTYDFAEPENESDFVGLNAGLDF